MVVLYFISVSSFPPYMHGYYLLECCSLCSVGNREFLKQGQDKGEKREASASGAKFKGVAKHSVIKINNTLIKYFKNSN